MKYGGVLVSNWVILCLFLFVYDNNTPRKVVLHTAARGDR